MAHQRHQLHLHQCRPEKCTGRTLRQRFSGWGRVLEEGVLRHHSLHLPHPVLSDNHQHHRGFPIIQPDQAADRRRPRGHDQRHGVVDL